VVEKNVEQNDYERGIEQSVATKIAGEMECPKHVLLDEHQRVMEEVKRKNEQKMLEEIKGAGIPQEEVNQQMEEFKRIQAEKLQSKENKHDEASNNFIQPFQGDRNSSDHRELRQSNPYDYQERHGSSNCHEDLHNRAGHYKHNQSPRVPDIGTSVDKLQEIPVAHTGGGPSLDVTVNSMVQQIAYME